MRPAASAAPLGAIAAGGSLTWHERNRSRRLLDLLRSRYSIVERRADETVATRSASNIGRSSKLGADPGEEVIGDRLGTTMTEHSPDLKLQQTLNAPNRRGKVHHIEKLTLTQQTFRDDVMTELVDGV